MDSFHKIHSRLADKVSKMRFGEQVMDGEIMTALRFNKNWDRITCHGTYKIFKVKNRLSWQLEVRDEQGEVKSIIGLNSSLKDMLGHKRRRRFHPSNAARYEVEDQIRDFRSRSPPGQYEVDHITPFETLFTTWLKSKTLSLDDIRVEKPDPRDNRWQFRDRSLASDWHAFHKEHARLQLLTSFEHRNKTAKSNARNSSNSF